MKMAAVGTRGELVAGRGDGFGLAFKADALWVGTAIEGASSTVPPARWSRPRRRSAACGRPWRARAGSRSAAGWR